jgi:hypothetical protein
VILELNGSATILIERNTMAIKVAHDQFSKGMYRLSKDDLKWNSLIPCADLQEFLQSSYDKFEERLNWAAEFDGAWYASNLLDAAQTQNPDWATHVFIYFIEDK